MKRQRHKYRTSRGRRLDMLLVVTILAWVLSSGQACFCSHSSAVESNGESGRVGAGVESSVEDHARVASARSLGESHEHGRGSDEPAGCEHASYSLSDVDCDAGCGNTHSSDSGDPCGPDRPCDCGGASVAGIKTIESTAGDTISLAVSKALREVRVKWMAWDFVGRGYPRLTARATGPAVFLEFCTFRC